MYQGDIKNINPSHYKQGKLEVIEIIEDELTDDEFKGFCKGLIIKYILRADYKNGVEDLEKAEWYLNRLINHFKVNNSDHANDSDHTNDSYHTKASNNNSTGSV